MPDQKFILRDFIPEDCVHFPALLKAVWKIQTDEEYWIWKYLKPPFPANGWVAEKENGNIVAFTGYWHRPAKIYNSKITPAMLVDVMAVPDYRGGKVYGKISERIVELVRGETVFGFTNPVSRRLFKTLVKDLIKIDANIPVFVSFIDGGYTVSSNKLIKSIVGSVTRFAHKMRLKIPGNKNILVQEAAGKIEDEFDQLWEDVSAEYAFILNRSKDYLQWRYISSHTREYQIWKAMEGERLVGYLVTTVRHESDRTRGYLIDWLVSRKREDVFCQMINTAFGWFVDQRVDSIETWLMDHEKQWLKILRSYFFIRTKRNVSFLMAPIAYERSNSILNNAKNIFVTIGDSDYLATANI
jgi:hypothetical protein